MHQVSKIVAPWIVKIDQYRNRIVAGQGKGEFPEAFNQIGIGTDRRGLIFFCSCLYLVCSSEMDTQIMRVIRLVIMKSVGIEGSSACTAGKRLLQNVLCRSWRPS